VKNPISDEFGLGGQAERNEDSEQQKPQPREEAAKVVAGVVSRILSHFGFG
jgi:hypothetical protein